MNTRKSLLMLLFIGLISIAFALLTPILLVMVSDSASSIIGGMDVPTYFFLLTHTLDGLMLCVALFGVATSICSLLAVIFYNRLHHICRLKTSCIALCLSAVGGLGLTCATMCYIIGAFNEQAKYPIAYPFSLAIGIVSLFAFAILLYAYYRTRKVCLSFLGVFFDILTSVLYLPAFFFSFSYLVDFIGA